MRMEKKNVYSFLFGFIVYLFIYCYGLFTFVCFYFIFSSISVCHITCFFFFFCSQQPYFLYDGFALINSSYNSIF